ncbi:MAG: NAD(P)-dependent oxidoreductase [Rickettsiales bacterium]
MILPIGLDMCRLSLALVGEGNGLRNRYAKLCEAGAQKLSVFSERTHIDVHSDHVMHHRYPDSYEVGKFHFVMAVDLSPQETDIIVSAARAAKVPLNVEDMTEFCDFHFAAVVQRGELALSVHTAGKSPALAARLREWLALAFPPIWERRILEMARRRELKRSDGLAPHQVNDDARAFMEDRAWLPQIYHENEDSI